MIASQDPYSTKELGHRLRTFLEHAQQLKNNTETNLIESRQRAHPNSNPANNEEKSTQTNDLLLKTDLAESRPENGVTNEPEDPFQKKKEDQFKEILHLHSLQIAQIENDCQDTVNEIQEQHNRLEAEYEECATKLQNTLKHSATLFCLVKKFQKKNQENDTEILKLRNQNKTLTTKLNMAEKQTDDLKEANLNLQKKLKEAHLALLEAVQQVHSTVQLKHSEFVNKLEETQRLVINS